MASASDSGLVYTPDNTPFHGAATVVISDTMPPASASMPVAPASARPWWRDPWKLGLVALGGVLVLTLLTPRRD